MSFSFVNNSYFFLNNSCSMTGLFSDSEEQKNVHLRITKKDGSSKKFKISFTENISFAPISLESGDVLRISQSSYPPVEIIPVFNHSKNESPIEHLKNETLQKIFLVERAGLQLHAKILRNNLSKIKTRNEINIILKEANDLIDFSKINAVYFLFLNDNFSILNH